MGCDLCGQDRVLFDARVEGTVVSVCDSCKEYGEVIQKAPVVKHRQSRQPVHTQREVLQIVRANYAKHIKEGREKLGLKQEELAKQLRIKLSQLHKYESGLQKPDFETARLLERGLSITLMQEHVEEHEKKAAPAPSGPLTIGDMIKRR